MKLLASLCLLAVLAPAPVATAQFSYLNLTVPPGTTAIIWNGAPALCIVGSQLASFRNPLTGPSVQLQIQGMGVWDWRPCTVGNSYNIQSEDYDMWGPHWPVGQIPASGLDINLGRGPTMNYWPVSSVSVFSFPTVTYWVDYCPMAGACGQCPAVARGPEGVCVVATLALK